MDFRASQILAEKAHEVHNSQTILLFSISSCPGLIIVELRAGQTCTYVPGSHTRVLWIGTGPPETSIMLFSDPIELEYGQYQ
jgi:hypothetical protein